MTELHPFDSAQHLETEADIAAYLEACAAEEDPALMAHARGVVARARSVSRVARDAGMTREGVYKALSGEGNPSLATVMKVARALGYRLTFQPR